MKKKSLSPQLKTPSHSFQGQWISLLVETSTSWGRQIIIGASNFTKGYTPYKIAVETKGNEEKFSLPRNLNCLGAIARIKTGSMAKELQSTGIPIINVSGIDLPEELFPRVTTDIALRLQGSAQQAG